MMTRLEAEHRARAIWGDRARVLPTPTQYKQNRQSWWVDLPDQASVHFLDENGHVACGHDTCKLAEQRLP